MCSQKAIVILSFIMILSLCWMPGRSANASSATSIKDSISGLPDADGALLWNTFLGTATYDDGYDIAIDGNENLYITGVSDSTWGSPIISAHTPGLGHDAFVAKMDGSGNLLWNTYLGGGADDMGLGIALDGSGNIYVSGSSPAAWGSPKRVFTAGSTNVFVAKLDSSGMLLWNTFFPLGRTLGELFGLAVDSRGNVYISADSAVSWGTPIRAYTGGPDDAFVAKLDSDGTLLWNTFLGGSSMDESYGLTLDSSGNVYVSGVSTAAWGTPVRAYSASVDTFVAQLDSNGTLQWHTFLGGIGQDYGFGIAVDGTGKIYSTGYSDASWGSPLSPISTTNETFVTRLDADGTLIWNTFAFGTGHGIAADASGYIYVSGFAFPAKAFALKLDPAGTPVWSTLMESTGASDWTFATRIVVAGSRNVYVVGFSPATWGTPLNGYSGGDDAFVAKLQGSGPLYVKANAPGSNDGTSWTNAYTSLQSALAAASSGDQIWVAQGTYLPTTDTDRTVSFALRDGVVVYGGFAGAPSTEGDLSQRDPALNQTILSGDIGVQADASDNSYHVVVGSSVSGNAALDGFTITAGNANAWPNDTGGGGMQIDGISHITLSAVTFTNNTAASEGGGLTDHGSTGGSLELTNVAFTGNMAFVGGGMVGGPSNPALTDVTFDGNTAHAGGGMANANGNPTLTDVTFSNNTATGDPSDGGGGGMYNEGSSPVLTKVDFNANTASTGGGMSNNIDRFRNRRSNPILTNVTFTSNTATSSYSLYGGGGMHNINGSGATLMNVTFTGNSAITGGGMHNDLGSSPTLTDVTFSNNTAFLDGGGMSNHSSSNPQLTDVTFSGNAVTGIGGGMANDNSNPVLTNVTFNGNTAEAGGGIFNSNSSLQLTNGTFSGNSAIGTDPQDGGGGMYNEGGTPTLNNMTFNGNTAAHGAAMQNLSSNPSISNSIFWGGTSVEIDSYDTSAPTIRDSIVAGGCPLLSTCTHVLDADPKLGPLKNNGGFTQTRALLAGSSAIDAGGVNVPCEPTDQRGITRPQGAACDIGGFELTFSTISGNAGTAGATLAYAGGSTSADQNGDYALKVPYGWSGIITPSKAGYSFDPPYLDYTDVNTDRTDQNYTATALEYTLTIRSAHGTVNCSAPGPYHYGNVVQLTAVSDTGWRFVNWTGDVVATDNPVTIAMNGSKTVQANYTQIPLSTLTSRSSGRYDGWLIESAENSNKGGSLNATGPVFNLGDTSDRRQYRAVLSFKAILPENAVISGGTLKIKKAALIGKNPFLKFGNIVADIKMGFLGTKPALQLMDFQSPASWTPALTILNQPVNGWYSAQLAPSALLYINPAGITQLRLRFQSDDNNNRVADYLKFYSGNATEVNRPMLLLQYFLP